MVEHAVENDLDAVLVQRAADVREVRVRAQTAVHPAVVAGVVAVVVGLENRGEVHSVAAETRDMLRPVGHLADARHGYAVVRARCAAEADGINLIKYTVKSPHNFFSFATGGTISIMNITKKCNRLT